MSCDYTHFMSRKLTLLKQIMYISVLVLIEFLWYNFQLMETQDKLSEKDEDLSSKSTESEQKVCSL